MFTCQLLAPYAVNANGALTAQVLFTDGPTTVPFPAGPAGDERALWDAITGKLAQLNANAASVAHPAATPGAVDPAAILAALTPSPAPTPEPTPDQLAAEAAQAAIAAAAQQQQQDALIVSLVTAGYLDANDPVVASTVSAAQTRQGAASGVQTSPPTPAPQGLS